MSDAIAHYYGEATATCVARHHNETPTAWVVRQGGDAGLRCALFWTSPSDEVQRGFANHDEATRDAAYGVALVSAEVHLGLVALRRAQGRSGADYYLVPANSRVSSGAELDLDRDDLVRLEVSGIDHDDEAKLWSRLRMKVKQTESASSPFPALAGVVGFRTGTTLFALPEAG